jgi:TatD DNase family protein
MIDSHCHLADEAFEADLDETIARATDAGVSSALCVLSAGDEAEAARARRVRDRWPAVRFAAGVHPHNAGAYDDAGGGEAARVAQIHGALFGACAIGEIGLDYHYDFAPRRVQRDVFVAQVQLALTLDLPIIIHTREATDDTFAVLREAGRGLRGVFHCFTGDTAMARRALEIDFHVSFAGIVTFPKAAEIRDAAKIVPDHRLLIETDSPYLAPVPHRGKRNEPAHVARVLAALATLRGEPVSSLEVAVTRNFDALFRPKSATAMA